MKKGSPLKIIVIVLVIFALVVAGGIAALYIMFPPQKIIALIVPHVEKALGRKVTLDKAGISVFPQLGLTLSGLRVANTSRDGFSSEPFVSVEKFTVSISVVSIFKGYPEITNILLRRPQVRVEVDKKGAFNFDDLAVMAKDTVKKEKAKEGKPVLPVPLTLKKFAIENGAIVYTDAKTGNQVIIESVNEQIGVSMDKELRDIKTTGRLALGNISVKTKEIKKPLKNITFTFSHDIAANLADGAGSVKVNEIRLSLQKIFISLKGSVENALSPSPIFDLAVVSDPISIADLLKEVPVELAPAVAKMTASGDMEIGLIIKGALEAGKPLPMQGKLALKNVMMKTADMPASINDFNTDISFTDNSLAINAMKLRFGSNPIAIKATVNNFKKPMIDAAVQADIKLGEIKNIVQLPKDALLDGRIIADIKAKGEADPADPSKLDLKGLVNLQNVKMVWSPLIKPAEITGALTLSTKAVGQNMSVHIGPSSFTMSTTITNFLSYVLPDKAKKLPRTNVEFKLTSPYLNVDEILMPPKPQASKTAQPPNASGAPVPIAPLPSVDVKGLVTANKIIYSGFTMNNLVAKISVINDIALFDFTTGFAGGTIGTVLNADMRNTQNIAFKNTLSIKSVEVNDLMQRFGGYIKPTTPLNRELAQVNKCLFGRINIQSSVSGSGGTAEAITKTITGAIGVQMADGKIVNAPVTRAVSSSFTKFLKTDKLGNFDDMKISDLAAKIRLADGRALFDDLKIKSNIGDWAAKGYVGFDALMDLVVSTRLSPELSGRLLAAEGAVKNIAKGMLGKTQLAGAAGLLDKTNLVPRDKENRVTLKFGLGGPVASPKATSLAFGEGAAGTSAQQQPTPKQQVQEQVQQKVQQVQQQAKQVVEQKKEEVKVEVKKAETQAKDQVKGKLKGIFGK
jgi:uncharacterized protein involved in outer membrane biogenesis